MLYCVVLCCVVMYCGVLWCVVLYCGVLYCVVLWCVVVTLCCVVFCFLGLDVDGIYRVSGNLAVIQRLRHKADHGKHYVTHNTFQHVSQ